MKESKSTSTTSSIYFANLDALRFVAALIVLVFHLENKKMHFGLRNIWGFKAFGQLGGHGVTIFFVLSGFLISYLLMAEKKETKSVNIKKFYLRRIFRIWPLYYLIIILGLFLLPGLGIFEIPHLSKLQDSLGLQATLFYFLFLPNIAFIYYGNVPFLDQTWSIGVEEQFYVFWPILFVYFKTSVLKLFLFVIGILVLLKIIAYQLNVQGVTHISNVKTESLYLFFKLTRFSCMAIGAIAAYLFFKREIFQKNLLLFFFKNVQLLLYSQIGYFLIFGLQKIPLVIGFFLFGVCLFINIKKVQINAYIPSAIFIVVSICCLITGMTRQLIVIDDEVFSLLFGILILNLSNTATSIINVKNKVLLYLGKVSYGIYMYHNMVIVFSIWLITKVAKIESYSIWLYVVSILLTIFLSMLSYEFFEKKFLRLKRKYVVIKSGNN